MPYTRCLFISMLFALGCPPVASASSRAAPWRVEMTLLGGYGLADGLRVPNARFDVAAAPRFGVLADVRVGEGLQLEVLYSRQETDLFRETEVLFGPETFLFDLTVEQFEFGGLAELGGRDGVRPFVVFTLGATRFDPSPSGLSSEWGFSAGLGGGIKTIVARRLGFRFEARAQPVLMESSSRIFCIEPGACLVDLDGTFLFQASVSAGVSLGF